MPAASQPTLSGRQRAEAFQATEEYSRVKYDLAEFFVAEAVFTGVLDPRQRDAAVEFGNRILAEADGTYGYFLGYNLIGNITSAHLDLEVTAQSNPELRARLDALKQVADLAIRYSQTGKLIEQFMPSDEFMIYCWKLAIDRGIIPPPNKEE
jgi:hypothetical protein